MYNRYSVYMLFYNIGNCAESCAIACFKKQRAERGCVFRKEKLFYNIGNCVELYAIACFKKQRAKRGCVFRKEKLFYNIGNCAESCAIACFKKQRAKCGCVFRKEKLFYNIAFYFECSTSTSFSRMTVLPSGMTTLPLRLIKIISISGDWPISDTCFPHQMFSLLTEISRN